MILHLSENHRYLKAILDIARGEDPRFDLAESELLRASLEGQEEGLARLMALGYDPTTWVSEDTTPTEAFAIIEMSAAGRIWLWIWLQFRGSLDRAWRESLGAWLLSRAEAKVKEVSTRGFLVQGSEQVFPTLSTSAPVGAPLSVSPRAGRVLATNEEVQLWNETYRDDYPTGITMEED